MSWVAGFVAGMFCGVVGFLALLAGWAYRIWREDMQ